MAVWGGSRVPGIVEAGAGPSDIVPPPVQVELSDTAPAEADADLLCVGLFDGEELPG